MDWNISILSCQFWTFCAFFHPNHAKALHIVLGRQEETTAGLYLLKENIAAAGHLFFSITSNIYIGST